MYLNVLNCFQSQVFNTEIELTWINRNQKGFNKQIELEFYNKS